ncbi:MAG TPA: serine/threonine dehydratase, partial [Stenotrophomonas sp.]|nr:serine/threonine dehydratase [Stenotrophomonas sp.]
PRKPRRRRTDANRTPPRSPAKASVQTASPSPSHLQAATPAVEEISL